MILVLSIILFLLLALIGKKRGIKAFCTLFINYFLIIISVILICWGFNPVIISLIFCLGTSAFILFFLNGANIKTKVAYASVIIVLLLMLALIIFVVLKGNLNGFSIENGEIIFVYDANIHVNYIYIGIAIILMSLTGAITDTALDISTSLNEIYENNCKITFKELIASGKNIGSDVLGTMINTLFFVFLGEFMGFFILHYKYDFVMIINNKIFAQEISQLLIGSLGCILIIPITILIQSWVYTRSNYFMKRIFS